MRCFDPVLAWWRARRDAARRQRAARRELDRLFGDPRRLAPVRLKPHHRHRAVILEIDASADGAPRRVLFGIVRHPKTHPLAPRGEDVLELIEVELPDGVPRQVGGGNLTRM